MNLIKSFPVIFFTVVFACCKPGTNNSNHLNMGGNIKNNKIIIENHDQGYPNALVSEFALAPVEWNGAELTEWLTAKIEAEGVELHTFKASPNATYEPHKGPGEWIGIVTSGSGKSILTDDAGVTRREVPFSKGDVFVFRTQTMHGWQIGPEGAEMIFVTKAGN
jgi:hypothetical protein